MAYELQGRLSVKILFRDLEFPFSEKNVLEFMHLTCCTRIGVPMLHFAVLDVINFFEGTASLSDSLPITIVLTVPSQTGVSDTRVYNFRMNTFSKTQSSGGRRYEFDAYLNCPEYWHSSSLPPLTGSSQGVIAQIAAKCSLKFEGVTTADSQVWLPRNQPYHKWARQITRHAYRSDTSCLVLGLDLSGLLRLVDVNDSSSKPTADISLGVPKSGFLLAADFLPNTSSGSLNHISGYSSIHVEQEPLKSVVHTQHRNVSVTKKAKEGSLLVNKDVFSKTARAKVKFSPISPGNVHPNYQKARYQNHRFANLFSSALDILLLEPSPIKVLDLVNVHLDSSDSYLSTYSGTYRAVSRTIYIQGTTYYEKIGLVRRSLNAPLPSSF